MAEESPTEQPQGSPAIPHGRNPMSTTPTNPTPVPTPPPTPQGAGADLPTPNPTPAPEAPAEDPTDWKAEARKWEQRAKADAGAAARLAEIEEASKTEAQKQADALAAAESKVKEYETREQVAAWKAEVSTETGVPAAALAGSTKEEIAAHAAVLQPLIEKPESEEPKPGVVPTIGKTPKNPANIPLRDQIAAAEQAGNKQVVAELKAMQLSAAAN